MVPTTVIQLKSSAWPPCSDMGLAPDDNLLFLRFCSREYWDYLQVFYRKADIISSPPFHQRVAPFSTALHRMPSSCRIGMPLLLDIAQQPVEAMQLLVAAVHVQVRTSVISKSLSFFLFALTGLFLQSSAPHVQAHGICALFPSFLLFVGRFAGSIIWTKVPFSRDIVAWRQDNVVLLQHSLTTNWFVAACENSEAAILETAITRCLGLLPTASSRTNLSATFDMFSTSTLSHGIPASASVMQLGKSLDSTGLMLEALHQRQTTQGGPASAALNETLLFGEHR